MSADIMNAMVNLLNILCMIILLSMVDSKP